MDPEIGPVDGDEGLAEIAQGGFAGVAGVLFGDHDPHRSVLQPAQGMDPVGVAAQAPLRLFGHLDLGDQVAGGRIPPRELDTGGFPDQTASAVAPDEILRPQRRAVGQLHVDAGVVLRETRHLTSAIDRHPQLVDPAGQDALDMFLPQGEPVVVPGGKVADVQRDPGETRDLGHLSLREEPIGDAALIEDLDGAGVQTAGARAVEVLAGAPLDDGHVDPRQRQLARQHQPRRAAAGDHHRMFGHATTPFLTPVSAPRRAPNGRGLQLSCIRFRQRAHASVRHHR